MDSGARRSSAAASTARSRCATWTSSPASCSHARARRRPDEAQLERRRSPRCRSRSSQALHQCRRRRGRGAQGHRRDGCARRRVSEARPTSTLLSANLAKMKRFLGAQLAARGVAEATERPTDVGGGSSPAAPARSGRSSRARMRSARSTRWPSSSGGTSRRARFRCSSSVRSGWCRRTFSRCWPTSRPRPWRRRERQAD